MANKGDLGWCLRVFLVAALVLALAYEEWKFALVLCAGGCIELIRYLYYH